MIDYKKYLTVTNGMIALCVIAVILLIKLGGGNPKYIPKNKSEIELLKEQNLTLAKQLEQKQKDYQQLFGEVQESRSKDSALKKQYEQRILKDYFTIEALKNKKNEKIKVIDTASDSLLWELLRAEAN